MKRAVFSSVIFAIALIMLSCSTPKYIYDQTSLNRQKELISTRGAIVLGEVILASAALVTSITLETEAEYYPSPQRFKRMTFTNPTTDTLYVNMLTDCILDTQNYCDFMDIRIPPQKTCKVLCPLGAEYNIYYSNTFRNDDDEMITINTEKASNIVLKPGTILTSTSK